MQNERQQRYSELFPLERWNQERFGVVGVGAIGRQIALTLAAMGSTEIVLWDHDTVSAVNLGTQGWRLSDVGTPKVHAARAAMLELSTECNVIALHQRWNQETCRVSVLLVAVDNMDSRLDIWEWIKAHEPRLLLVD